MSLNFIILLTIEVMAVFGIHKNMAWILKKEFRTKIKEIGATVLGQTDNIYVLNLNDEYGTSLDIWEIESKIPFDKISIDTNYSSNKINLTRYETVFGGTKGIVYNINYNRNFNKSFKLGISDMASIKYMFNGQNYIGVLGDDLFEYYIESDSKTDIMIQNNWENLELAIVIYKKEINYF